MAAMWEGEDGLSVRVSGEGKDFILLCTRERLQQGKGPVTWVSVGVAFYIWDQGGPVEVNLKQSSAMGKAREKSIHVERSQRSVEH